MPTIPTPDQFPTWQEWAQYVVDVLNNDPSGTTGTSATSNPPPIKKILKAAAGSYMLVGQDAQSYFGPHHYQLPALTTNYALSGNDAGLLWSAHQALAANAGAYAVTGQPANLTKTTNLPTQGAAFPTFHSIGVYWQPVDTTGAAVVPLGNKVNIQYKRAGESSWHRGHDLWYDDTYGLRIGRPKEARGSIFFCLPDTDYTVQFGLPQQDGTTQWIAQLTTRTWSENPPIGTTIQPFSGTNTTFSSSNYPNGAGSRRQILLMNRSGTAAGYTLYDFTGQNAVANAQQKKLDGTLYNNAADHCVVISGHNMILRGLKCIGGGIASIFIDPGSTDIWIEDCDISGFNQQWLDGGTHTVTITYPGNVTTSTPVTFIQGVNEDSGICIQPDPGKYGSAQTTRVILQRNKIHNQLYGNQPWDFGHPAGGSGVLMYPSGGNHVFRYNEFYATVPNNDGTDSGYTGTPSWGQFFADCITGGSNFDFNGSPSPNTDVYKNIFMHSMDDGMEFEGGDMNCRSWANYIDYTATGLASASVAVGPLYFIRNVYNRCRDRYLGQWGTRAEWGSDRLGMFKAGSDSKTGDGRRYVYHNTCLQLPDPNGNQPLGAAYGISNANTDNGTHGISNTVSRNNVYAIFQDSWDAVVPQQTSGPANDFDYDLTNANMGIAEGHGTANSTIKYQVGNGDSASWTGKYRLQPGSPGYDSGLVLNGINNDVPAPYQYLGAGPDRGAHEDGVSDMLFGIAAANSGA